MMMTQGKLVCAICDVWPGMWIVVDDKLHLFISKYNIIDYRELGENLSDEELRAMIDEFDKDGDGESKALLFKIATSYICKNNYCLFSFLFTVNESEFMDILTGDS